MIPLLRNVDIVGNQYRDAPARAEFLRLEPGDMVVLKPTPSNPADPFAVEVWSDIHHIGFLPKQVSAVVHLTRMRPEIELWLEATVTEVLRDLPWHVRVTVTAE